MKYLWIALAVFVLADILFVVFVFWKRRVRKPSPELKKLIRDNWFVIGEKADREPAAAVMDADKLFLHALERLGYRGDTVAKMRAVQSRLGDKQAVWDAHKFRNRLAHEVGVSVSPQQAHASLRAFERALRDLSLLP